MSPFALQVAIALVSFLSVVVRLIGFDGKFRKGSANFLVREFLRLERSGCDELQVFRLIRIECRPTRLFRGIAFSCSPISPTLDLELSDL